MDAWGRQRSLARTTALWGGASIVAGVVMAGRDDPWWRAFGGQHVGWGAVDLAIVAAVSGLQRRQLRRLADPYDPVVLERQRRKLRIILAVNAVADAGYCVTGVVLRRRRHRPRAAGAGAAIIIQGAFLLLHDSYHALRSTRADLVAAHPPHRGI